jgi:hypothetical protein
MGPAPKIGAEQSFAEHLIETVGRAFRGQALFRGAVDLARALETFQDY